jgi:hypothetical protein
MRKSGLVINQWKVNMTNHDDEFKSRITLRCAPFHPGYGADSIADIACA